MLCVVVLILLLSVTVAADKTEKREPLWLHSIEHLPVGRKTKLGLGAAWAYTSSKKGDEVENVVNEVFQLIPRLTDKKTSFSAGEKYNPYSLGHMCWSKGKAEGLNTIVKDGKVEKVTTREGKTWYEVKFHFEHLRLTVDKCGLKIGKSKNTGKCVVDASKTVFKVVFTVHNIDSYTHVLSSLLNKQCMLTIVDVEVEDLNGFKVEVEKDDGPYSAAVVTSFTHNPFMKSMLTVVGRVSVHDSLETSGSVLCKDPDLDVYIQHHDQAYLEYVEKKMKPHGHSRTPTFNELCGNNWKTRMDDLGDDLEDGVDKVISGAHVKGGHEQSKLSKKLSGITGHHHSHRSLSKLFHPRKRDVVQYAVGHELDNPFN